MGFFSTLRNSSQKSKKLKQISLALGGGRKTMSLEDLFDDSRDKVLEEMLDYCFSDPNLSVLLHEFSVSREELKNLYYILLNHGLGQWVRGHYVAVSALFFPQTLRYLLKYFTIEKLDRAKAYRVLEYFDKREVGEIKDKH